jgi:hypothetical protein
MSFPLSKMLSNTFNLGSLSYSILKVFVDLRWVNEQLLSESLLISLQWTFIQGYITCRRHKYRGKVRVQVKLSLCLTKHHAIKTYGMVEVKLYAFLSSALDGGEWSVSHPGRFNPGIRAYDTHWMWSLVEFRAGLNAVIKRKMSFSWENRTPIVQSVA